MPPKRTGRLPDVQLDPSAEYRDPIGEIVLRWTRLEYQLGVIIRVIRQQSKAEQRETLYNKRTSELCRLARDEARKVETRDKQLADELLSFVRRTGRGAKRRNGYVHSLYGHWAGDRRKPMRFKMKSTSGDEVLHDGASPLELARFADHVRELQVSAQDLTTRLKGIYGTRR